MINEHYLSMLSNKSVIRNLSEYATARGKEIGYENVFDFSLGNPSVPAPQSFTDTALDLLKNMEPLRLHGYSPTLGIPEVKDKVETYTASKLQVEAYEFTPSNLMKCWVILLGYGLLYALIGLVSLEFIDKDKR